MNYRRAGARLLIQKSFCIALILVFGMAIFTAGSFAGQSCGSICCCQSIPISMAHNAGEQIRASMGCCARTPVNPCDIGSARKQELQEFTLCSTGFHFSQPGGPAVIFNLSGSEARNFSAIVISQPVGLQIISPPIYLQKLSFLI
jgi:hypothetical protein